MRPPARSTSWFGVFTSGAFFSRWTWVATAPFAVTVLGGYDAASGVGERIGGIAIAALVHVLCGVLGLGAAWAERATASGALRATVVASTVVAIGVLRPLSIDWCTRITGLTLFPAPMPVRVATNVIAVLVATTLVAALVQALRRRQSIVTDLRIVLAWIEAEGTHGRRLVAEAKRVLSATARLLLVQLRALERLGAEQMSPIVRATALRSFAVEVVRPSGHRLSELRDGEELEQQLDRESEPVAAEPTPRATPALLPVPVGVPAGLYVLALLPFVASRFPLSGVFTASVLALLVGCVGEGLVRFVVHRAARRWSTSVVIVGSVATAVAIFVTTAPFVEPAAAVATAPVLYAALAVMCGAVAALRTELRQQEECLSERLQAYRADEHDGRRRAEHALTEAAQRLHGDVQGDCLVAATRLEGADAATVWDVAISDIRTAIAQLDRPRSSVAPSAQATMETLLGGWGRVIDLQWAADAEAWELADERQELQQQLVDATSEALTNILRHASTRVASISLSGAGGRLRLVVESPGRVMTVLGTGIGLRTLHARAESVELAEHDGVVRLSVSLGGPVTPES